MKLTYLKSIFVFSIAVALLAASGCKKLEDFGDTDTRTDQSNDPTTAFLLSSAQSAVPGILSSSAGGIRGSLYAQQWAETQYTDVSLYGNPQLDFGSYATSLMDLQTIINLNTNPATKSGFNVLGTATAPLGSNGSQIAIATILKVYYLWTITDRWGDIPYSQALKGAANLTPSYDTQEEIYATMMGDLKSAMSSFDTSNAVIGDLYYPTPPITPITPPALKAAYINKQIASWKKVANSLRMLIALRMSNVPGTTAATEFAAAAADPAGAIEVNADNLKLAFPGGTALETNVFYSALNGRNDYAFSKTLGDILANMNDPRRSAFGSTGASFPYGLERDAAVAFDGSVSGAYAKPFKASVIAITSPIVIIPAAYVLLAKAEAAERGWIGGSAETYYNDGVAKSFEQWGQTDVATYLGGNANYNSGSGGGNNVGFLAAFPSVVGASAQTTTPRQRIQLQRYLASFGDGLQAWSEWRRTGIPNLTPTVYGVNTPKEIPRRLTYGTTEYAANPASVAEAVSRLTGGDKMSSRVWWDQ